MPVKQQNDADSITMRNKSVKNTLIPLQIQKKAVSLQCNNYTNSIKMSEKMYSYKYPHAAVTTDSVVFGYDGKDLHILLIERGIDPFKGSWALPGGFLKMDETVEEGALRELNEETGVADLYLEQFHVFSTVDRDPRERVITVAFYALVRKSDYKVIAGDDAVRACWFPSDELPPLAFDHEEIIAMAKEELRRKLRLEPIAFKLLDDSFTLGELQRLYELINGRTYDRRNFQKKMLSSGYLEERDRDIQEECIIGASEPVMEKLSSEVDAPSEKKQRGRKPHLFSFLSKAYEESEDKERNLFNP